MCLHIEPKTAVLCDLLTAAGAQVWLIGSPGTTRADVADWLSNTGVHVHAVPDDLDRAVAEAFVATLEDA